MGGFGLELADWLVLRGASKLVLSSRTGIRTGYQSLRVRLWRSYGAKVVVSLADITTESGVTDLLSEANRLGQVDAIFNLAVVSGVFLYFCKSPWELKYQRVTLFIEHLSTVDVTDIHEIADVTTLHFSCYIVRTSTNICERDSSWQCMCDDVQHSSQCVVQT